MKVNDKPNRFRHGFCIAIAFVTLLWGTSSVRANDHARHPEAWAVAQGMEGIFARQLLKSMRQTVSEEGLLETSTEAKFYRSMLDEEYADIISQRGDLGIADLVYDYLTPSQGGAKHENQ